MILVLVEVEEGRAALVSQEALTFARRLGGPVDAVVLAPPGTDLSGVVADCATQGVATVHVADGVKAHPCGRGGILVSHAADVGHRASFRSCGAL